jgi:hypothetical protein
MLPDIRVVVTALATTVLILVGFGLMAAVRITHQGLSGGSLVTSSQQDSVLVSQMTWRPPAEQVLQDAAMAAPLPWRPEQVLTLPHETTDLTALAPEERDLAERVLASVPPARYAAAAAADEESAQIGAVIAESLVLAHPSNHEPSAAAMPEPPATASISPPPSAPNAVVPAKKVSAPAITGKQTAKGRPGATARAAQVQPGAKPPRARRAARTAKPDKNPLDALFSLDQVN